MKAEFAVSVFERHFQKALSHRLDDGAWGDYDARYIFARHGRHLPKANKIEACKAALVEKRRLKEQRIRIRCDAADLDEGRLNCERASFSTGVSRQSSAEFELPADDRFQCRILACLNRNAATSPVGGVPFRIHPHAAGSVDAAARREIGGVSVDRHFATSGQQRKCVGG